MTLFPLQATRTPQKRLARATVLLKVQDMRACTCKVPFETAGQQATARRTRNSGEQPEP